MFDSLLSYLIRAISTMSPLLMIFLYLCGFISLNGNRNSIMYFALLKLQLHIFSVVKLRCFGLMGGEFDQTNILDLCFLTTVFISENHAPNTEQQKMVELLKMT